MLAAEARAEGVGVNLLGEAEHLPPLVLVEHGVAARAQREIEAEGMLRAEMRAPALICGQRHLIRPAAVDLGR